MLNKKMVVCAPIANVRREPLRANNSYVADPLQETQVIQGENIILLERKGDWLRIEAQDQAKYTPRRGWHGYPGWIEAHQAEEISQRLTRPTIEHQGRHAIVEKAMSFLDAPYLWGGLSPYQPQIHEIATGVDCSGLIHLAYRWSGYIIPRDAHDQFLMCRLISPTALQPGDLIFLSKTSRPLRIFHVILYTGSRLLEAKQNAGKVRLLPTSPLLQMQQGQCSGEEFLFFGSLLP